jgi:tetratricopeptide (TPR) repeat protein
MARFPNLRALGALLLLAAIAYAPALGNPLLFDDEILIAGNDRLALANVPKLVTPAYFDLFPGQLTSWRPVSVLSYMLNRTLFGDWYPGWRGVYLLMHVANAMLLVVLAARWGMAGPAAMAAGALFLLHPAHTEVFNQVSYNEEPMVTLLALLALLALLSLGAPGSRDSVRGGAAAAAAMTLGLGCKESALMLLPAALAINLSAPRRRGWGMPALLAAIALAYLLLRFRVLTNPVDARQMALSAGSLADGMPTLLMLVAIYLGRFLWPVGLSAVHDYRPAGWGDPTVWLGLLIVVALAGAAVWGILRRRTMTALPAVIFGASMLPLGYAVLFGGEIYAYDRYLYLPSVGLTLYLAQGLDALARLGPAGRRMALALPLAAAAAFVPLDWQRDRAWSDPVIFWEDNVGKAPSNAGAWGALGWVRLGRGEITPAIAAYREAVRLKPDFADARFNLGLLLARSGDSTGAAEQYSLVLETDPSHRAALLNLAILRYAGGEPAEARRLAQRLRAVDPSNAGALQLLEMTRGSGAGQAGEDPGPARN